MTSPTPEVPGRHVSDTPNAGPAAVVVADPKRPWKAYAGAAVTFLGLLWANVQGADNLASVGDWLTIIIPTVIAFGAIYGVVNPKVAAARR